MSWTGCKSARMIVANRGGWLLAFAACLGIIVITRMKLRRTVVFGLCDNKNICSTIGHYYRKMLFTNYY